MAAGRPSDQGSDSPGNGTMRLARARVLAGTQK